MLTERTYFAEPNVRRDLGCGAFPCLPEGLKCALGVFVALKDKSRQLLDGRVPADRLCEVGTSIPTQKRSEDGTYAYFEAYLKEHGLLPDDQEYLKAVAL